MALKYLKKLKLTRKNSSKKSRSPQNPRDETEKTVSEKNLSQEYVAMNVEQEPELSEDDAVKYGYNTYDYEDQESRFSEEDVEKYGYNTYDYEDQEPRPSEEDVAKYGYDTYDYEDQEPRLSEEDVAKYGYDTYDYEDQEPRLSEEDVAKYGYDTYDYVEQPAKVHSYNSQRMPRRSSLKGSNPTTTQRQRRRHSLTFSNSVSVANVTPTKSLSDKKILWFEDEDYEKMQQKVIKIAERAMSGEVASSGKKYCTRGLEKMMNEDCWTRRYAAWDAVMDEQEYQACNDQYDDDALSHSYRLASGVSSEEATLRALQDQQAVAKYLADTRKYCRRMSM